MKNAVQKADRFFPSTNRSQMLPEQQKTQTKISHTPNLQNSI